MADKSVAKFGIDVSGWQGKIDWPRVKEGVDFAYLKAGEGTTVVDNTYAFNAVSCLENQIPWGPYWYLRPARDPKEQADKFCTIAGESPLPPMCDIETMGGTTAERVLENSAVFMAEVERLFGRRPILYTYPSFWAGLTLERLKVTWTKYPLWIANYDVKAPLVPRPWTGWHIWQTSGKGKVAGVPDIVDTNVTTAEFLAWMADTPRDADLPAREGFRTLEQRAIKGV